MPQLHHTDIAALWHALLSLQPSAHDLNHLSAMQQVQVEYRTQHARPAVFSCYSVMARQTVTTSYLKGVMVGDHVMDVPENSDALPGIVIRDETKEEIEDSIAELPIADLHLLACPAIASQGLR